LAYTRSGGGGAMDAQHVHLWVQAWVDKDALHVRM
jgi:hypothetical protein